MKILVVDDELVSRKKLERIMASFGECTTAENGEDALKIAMSEDPPDLILLDIMMPGMDGYEMCKRLKDDNRTSDIPVIFISAERKQEDEARGFELGAVDYITKPFKPTIVKVRIHTHLELKKHRDQLEALVNQRTNELVKVNRTLKQEMQDRNKAEKEKHELERQLLQTQKMQAIGTLAGGIAHDFNNILAAILSYTELSILDLTEEDPLHHNLEQVIKASNRAKDLVGQILFFSRQSKQEKIPVDTIPIVKEVLKLIGASFPSTIEIRKDISTPVGMIMADPTQIHQILMNLFTNASHAMGDRGILTVRLEDVVLDADCGKDYPELAPGPHLKLTVSDTGHGMDQATLACIFDPYYTTKEPGEGTGLGLSVVKGIVNSHDGSIKVLSEPGVGSSFEVLFPKTSSMKCIQTGAAGPIPKGRERILFVDDEEMLVDAGKRVLNRLGYEVVAETSSIEALKTFRDHPEEFDLIITDQTMPHMTGVELSKEIFSIRPDVPIILCTGFSEIITEMKEGTDGIKDFVMKPIVMREWAEIIHRTLKGHTPVSHE